MKYVSTRGADAVDFETACLSGLAPDGGLYTPTEIPTLSRGSASESYVQLATRILSAFAHGSLTPDIVAASVERAYKSFAHHSVAPLVQMGPNRWMLELHHGPTLAFKDVAMQIIAQLYDHFLTERGERLTVLCATSGDTGGAAAAAFANLASVDLFILHPHERISPIQRRFMTSTGADNVHNFAIDGDFDDAQAIVKALFADSAFRTQVNLSGVNSINWTRVAAQSVYFAAAQAQLGMDTPIRFVVPTGNFGDALAGYVAARCGLLNGFECVSAVNANRTMVDLFSDGRLRRAPAHATISPAMDIHLPSNFERLLFEVSSRDPSIVRTFYDSYAQSGEASLSDTIVSRIGCTGLSAVTVGDADTETEMRRVFAETGWLVCPHTAVASHASRHAPSESVDVILATAHAAKFPETVERVTGLKPDLPHRTAETLSTDERFERFPADLAIVRSEIEKRTGAR